MLKKSVFKISGMHCNTCSLNIDWELEEAQGIKEASTSYVKQEAEVIFDSNIIKPEKIIEIIKKTGYDANVLDGK